MYANKHTDRKQKPISSSVHNIYLYHDIYKYYLFYKLYGGMVVTVYHHVPVIIGYIKCVCDRERYIFQRNITWEDCRFAHKQLIIPQIGELRK